jgi:ParB-like chromosome segregation protein Spo0J
VARNEDKLYAELFLNLGGRQRKRLDWIRLAQTVKTLADRHKTYRELATKLGVSTWLIRSIVSLLDLPDEIQEMVRRGEILFDSASRLNTLKDRKLQISVARKIRNLPSRAQREIIQHARRLPDSDAVEFRDRVTLAPPPPERIHVLICRIKEDELTALRDYCKKNRTTTNEVVERAIKQYISPAG